MSGTMRKGRRKAKSYLGFDARHATISDQPFQPAYQHRQNQGEPLEPLPRVDTAKPYGSRGPEPPEWEISHIQLNIIIESKALSVRIRE
jgi:hypothetical protein